MRTRCLKSTRALFLFLPLLLAACGGGESSDQRPPTPIELVQGSWRGVLAEQGTICEGVEVKGTLRTKEVVYKIAADKDIISMTDESAQAYTGGFISGTDFDLGWTLVSAASVDETKINFRNLHDQTIEVSFRHMSGVKGAICTNTWSGKLKKQ